MALFSPVLLWNAQHGWASFAFQGGRAEAGRWHLLAPLVVLGGEAAFLLPWIWAPLMVVFATALRRGSADAGSWLLACLALFPIAVFAIVALWARGHVLFHWAAPGYLFLFPLLGAAVDSGGAAGSRVARYGLIATAGLICTGLFVIDSEVRLNWLPTVAEDFAPGKDPDLAALDWTSLRTDLAVRGLLGRPKLVVAALRWYEAGKIDYALGGRVKVICLGDDPREYRYVDGPASLAGDDVLILSPRRRATTILQRYARSFHRMDALPPIMLRHDGLPAMPISVVLGHGFQPGPRPQG